ncbi:MAG: uroporphyrinogen methyltransferase / synthase [Candidatus Eremiobacteraeota bacterium]|jgi:uroporphyrinogen III methyltransferase/synthase|nr:uroporphyrinogen methyltransferase / synthase [Candidatus Eremiobacteraeota bacterium]
MPAGKVWLVGAGPGDPGLLTLKGARALAQCDTLVYDYLASQAIVSLAPPDCEKIYVGKKAGEHTLTQDEITALIVQLGLDGKKVVRLKGGDVFVFARGGEEAHALAKAGVPFEIVPGITSAIAAPAYAGIPVTHREHNTSFTIATGHEDPTKGYSSLDYAKLANRKATTIFLMAMGNLAGIVAKLRENGLEGDTPVGIVHEGTKPTQEVLTATIDTVIDEVARTGITAPAIVVIGDVVRERQNIRWFDAQPLFGKRVLVTRPAHQADDFATRLWEAGAEPILAPTIAIGAPDDPAAAREAAARVREYDWVVFTSRNGVDAFFDALGELGRDARAFGDARIAAIGPKTAEALATRGIRVDLIPPEFVNEAIASELLTRTSPGDRILIYRAQEAREVLPETLREHGRVADVVAAYATRFVHDPDLAAKTDRADIVTFTSSSTVGGFISNVPDAAALLASKTVAAIGPITARTARDAGIRVGVVPDEFTVDGLLRALSAAAVP